MEYKPVKKFMLAAISEARAGNRKSGKYPMGAVVAKGARIISRSPNGLPGQLDPTAHAELLAIKMASEKLKTRNLDGCVLYTTNEPCAMCSGAAVWANMSGIVYGANVDDLDRFWAKRRDPKATVRKFIFIRTQDVAGKAWPRIFIVGNFMRDECLKLFSLYRSQP